MKKKPKCFPRENSGKILAKNAQKADRSAHDLPPFLEYTICMYLIQNARARPLYIPSSKLKYGKKGNLARQILCTCTYVKKLDHTVKLINCNCNVLFLKKWFLRNEISQRMARQIKTNFINK